MARELELLHRFCHKQDGTDPSASLLATQVSLGFSIAFMMIHSLYLRGPCQLMLVGDKISKTLVVGFGMC